MSELMGQNEGKAAKILRAIKDGAETAREVEAVMPDGWLTLHQIAGHLSNLKRSGRIVESGMAIYWTEAARGGGDREVKVMRYKVAP